MSTTKIRKMDKVWNASFTKEMQRREKDMESGKVKGKSRTDRRIISFSLKQLL